MEKINRWMVQQDSDDNFIIYPIPMLPIRGYVAPDKKAAIEFTDRMYPIIGLGFGALMLGGYLGDRYFAIAVVLYFISIIFVNLNFVKQYPISGKQYSWKEYANQMNQGMSTFFVLFAFLGIVLFSIMVIGHAILYGTESVGYYIFAIGMTAYGFFIYLLIVFFRIKSLF